MPRTWTVLTKFALLTGALIFNPGNPLLAKDELGSTCLDPSLDQTIKIARLKSKHAQEFAQLYDQAILSKIATNESTKTLTTPTQYGEFIRDLDPSPNIFSILALKNSASRLQAPFSIQLPGSRQTPFSLVVEQDKTGKPLIASVTNAGNSDRLKRTLKKINTEQLSRQIGTKWLAFEKKRELIAQQSQKLFAELERRWPGSYWRQAEFEQIRLNDTQTRWILNQSEAKYADATADFLTDLCSRLAGSGLVQRSISNKKP